MLMEISVVQGKTGNDTNINVKLHTLQNPEKETNFEKVDLSFDGGQTLVKSSRLLKTRPTEK